MDTPYELHINAHRRENATEPTSLADFVTTAGAPVETVWLINNPHVSLYSLDTASSQAIFVEMSPEVNLAAAPFAYQAQYQGAQRLFAMPFSQLLTLAETLDTRLDRLILIFNIGRSGSTLLHQALNRVPGVVSLSEPDGFVPIWKGVTRLSDYEAISLMQASAKFLFRPQTFPNLAVAAIKFRGRNISLLRLSHRAFPEASLIFLYREAISWCVSWLRLAQQQGVDTDADRRAVEDVVTWLEDALGPISLDAVGVGHLSGTLSVTER